MRNLNRHLDLRSSPLLQPDRYRRAIADPAASWRAYHTDEVVLGPPTIRTANSPRSVLISGCRRPSGKLLSLFYQRIGTEIMVVALPLAIGISELSQPGPLRLCHDWVLRTRHPRPGPFWRGLVTSRPAGPTHGSLRRSGG